MFKIRQLFIKNLWNEKDFSISFNKDINILIGSNGIGKTTILKILNSIMHLETNYFYDLKFEHIKLLIQDDISGQQRTINVEKNNKNEVNISFSGKRMITEKNEYSEDILFEKNSSKERFYENQKKLNLLKTYNIPNTKWLTASRISTEDKDFYEMSILNKSRMAIEDSIIDRTSMYLSDPLDIKLRFLIMNINKEILNINTEIQKEDQYFRDSLFRSNFNNLDSAFSAETKHPYFVIAEKLKDNNYLENFIVQINNLKNDYLKDNTLNYSTYLNKKYTPTNLNIKNLNKLCSNIECNQLSIKDVFQISAISFWINAIELYENYIKKIDILKKIIFDFEQNFNLIFKNKFELDLNNSFFIKKKSNYEIIIPFDLSSGEKQMLIFLLETSLYLKSECIYLIDEPELSLHLKWQKDYISILQSSNSDNQYFLATHSPDIVSKFENKIINLNRMEV